MTIHLHNITKVFGEPPTQVLFDINHTIEEGEFVSLTGRSGSGKSTLLYIISSLDTPSTGTVSFSGTIIQRMSAKELHTFRNQHMGFVFQFHYLLPELSALENVLMPAFKYNQADDRRSYAKKLLDQFGLSNKIHRRPRQLSGGEQQRVAIARALVMEPNYLFADEPTGNLDSANGEIVMKLLQSIHQEKKTTILMVTHDPDFANMAQRQIHLVDGRIV